MPITILWLLTDKGPVEETLDKEFLSYHVCLSVKAVKSEQNGGRGRLKVEEPLEKPAFIFRLQHPAASQLQKDVREMIASHKIWKFPGSNY